MHYLSLNVYTTKDVYCVPTSKQKKTIWFPEKSRRFEERDTTVSWVGALLLLPITENVGESRDRFCPQGRFVASYFLEKRVENREAWKKEEN